MMLETLELAELCTPPLNTTCMSATEAMLFEPLLSCIALLTVILNLLVIISISHFRQLHTPTNVILLSLAVSDLFVGLTLMPNLIFSMQSCMFRVKFMCALWLLWGYILTSSCIGSMVLISVDRYVAICDPLHYSSMITINRAKVCVSLCWICSVAYNFIIIKDQLSQVDMLSPCPQECKVIISYILGAIDLILTFFGPITVIIVLYMRVFVVAVSQARVMRSQIAALKSTTGTVVVKKSEMRAAKTLGIVLLVFIFSLCPYFSPSLEGQDTNSTGGALTYIWLFYCNSTFNPLIYAFSYSWFRKAFMLIVSLKILHPGSCETKIM